MKSFSLVRKEGFRWFSSGNAVVKGFLEYQGQVYLQEKIADLFSHIENWEEFIATLRDVNGCFAVVLEVNGNIFAAVDKLRSIPLFFREDTVEVSDDINGFTGSLFKNLNESALLPFKNSGYTIGDDTLIDGVKQLQAGQALCAKGDQLTVSYYFRHWHSKVSSPVKSRESYYSELNKITAGISRRLVNSLDGRQVVIPLSGGYDSRYIAAMLYLEGYKNVVCYTYGRPESFEVGISKKVAAALGYEWHFVEYTSDKWKAYIKDEKFPIYASAFCSLPMIQEYLTVKELVEKDVILPSAIVVPGFCGDLLGGSYVPKAIKDGEFDKLKKKGLVHYIAEKHFSITDYSPDNNVLCQKIANDLGDLRVEGRRSFISKNEEFFTRHKVAKFVVNSLRAYEYFGLEWRMPLWDDELMNFWYSVDERERFDNSLYNNYLMDTVFKDCGVAFVKNDIGALQSRVTRYKYLNSIIRLVKPHIKNIFYSIRPPKYYDINRFDDLKSVLCEDIGHPSSPDEPINHVYAQWFIHRVL